MIKNIVFDIGNVLITYKDPSFLCKYGISEKDADTVINKILFGKDNDTWHKMDLGLTTEKECCDKYYREFPEYAEGIKAFFGYNDDWYTDNSETWKLLPKLKNSGYNLYILSNWNTASYERCVCHMPFIQYMNGIVISGTEGVRKPDLEIYKRLCERYSPDPKETFFLTIKNIM